MTTNKLYGAILGDLAGQPYEFPAMQHFPNVKDINLHNPHSVITDDTLLTLATARSIIEGMPIEDAYKEMYEKYPGDHYGKGFRDWAVTEKGTIGTSYGNGCLMRVSPYFYLAVDSKVRDEKIMKSCLTSHADPVSVLAVQKLIQSYDRAQGIRLRYDDIRGLESFPLPFEKFAVRADDTIDFVKKMYECHTSTHRALKSSISLGGDTDTNASILGELMNYTYDDLDDADIQYVESKLDPYLLGILRRFNEIFYNLNG